MAGDWIKFELTTLDKPEVCQIADEANIDSDAVVGKLLRVLETTEREIALARNIAMTLGDELPGYLDEYLATLDD